NSKVPLYVLNVTYPLVDDEVRRFCASKRAVLVIEEGQPDFIEQNLHAILRRAELPAKVHGKDMLPMAGEYTAAVVMEGIGRFTGVKRPVVRAQVGRPVLPRPPTFCTGCPERPIFTAMKLVERELGQHHVSCDIGCHLFSILPPFNIGNTTMGYGLGAAGASAFNMKADKRAIAVMGDGGVWHNGLTSSIGNAVFNKSDKVVIVV